MALPTMYFYPPLDPPPGYSEPPVLGLWRAAGGAVHEVEETGDRPPVWPEALFDYDLQRLSLGGPLLHQLLEEGRLLALLTGSTPAPLPSPRPAPSPVPAPGWTAPEYSDELYRAVLAECELRHDGPEDDFQQLVVRLVCAVLHRAER